MPSTSPAPVAPGSLPKLSSRKKLDTLLPLEPLLSAPRAPAHAVRYTRQAPATFEVQKGCLLPPEHLSLLG